MWGLLSNTLLSPTAHATHDLRPQIQRHGSSSGWGLLGCSVSRCRGTYGVAKKINHFEERQVVLICSDFPPLSLSALRVLCCVCRVFDTIRWEEARGKIWESLLMRLSYSEGRPENEGMAAASCCGRIQNRKQIQNLNFDFSNCSRTSPRTRRDRNGQGRDGRKLGSCGERCCWRKDFQQRCVEVRELRVGDHEVGLLTCGRHEVGADRV